MPVYMIRAGATGPVKIGHSHDPLGRLANLQVSHWETLKIIRVFEGGAKEEAQLHLRFVDLHIRGEWHSFSRAMMGDVGLATMPVPRRPQLLNKVDPITGKVGRPWTDAERKAAGDRQRAIQADPMKRAARKAKIKETFARKRAEAQLQAALRKQEAA